jgi:hypothetical protein
MNSAKIADRPGVFVQNGMIPESAQHLIGALVREDIWDKNVLDSATPNNKG